MSARDDPKTILPITHFETTADASDITNTAFDRLQSADVGAVGLTSVVTELFSELALNAAQHSESEVGAFGCVQFYKFEGGARFTCTVADGGIGVFKSLRRNEALRSRVNYDWDALELAVRERVSGTGDLHRGIGLYGVSEDVRQPGRSLLLHSGLGSLEITEAGEFRKANPIVPRNVGLSLNPRVTMCTLRVKDILKDRILVSRESAHLLEGALSAMMDAARTPGNPSGTISVGVDFEGIEGIAPSFLDELLSIFQSLIEAETNGRERCLIVANPPTRLSLKFEGVARGHGMSVRALPDGSWLLTDTRNTCA